MPRTNKVFDTSMLIWAWRTSRGGLRGPVDAGVAEEWARRLIDLYRTDAIVTPVRIEFAAGARDAAESKVFRAYLAMFQNIDGGRILPEDWAEALRLAEWIPHDGRPRQLGDCLIRAIARRLKCDVLTRDTGFPHR
jgi:predicted nucleic acid-binding protein